MASVPLVAARPFHPFVFVGARHCCARLFAFPGTATLGRAVRASCVPVLEGVIPNAVRDPCQNHNPHFPLDRIMAGVLLCVRIDTIATFH
ncbi:MAG: hypothetical protein DMG38_20870 [Acidobacteria bacterium]|nr:MAG: hypothetical protein DMG38_20870 [Acidobacteriota bacterium]